MELVLVFDLGGEAHGLPAAEVVKVVEPGPISRLPRLPPAVRGIMHHRGRVITVVDLGLVVSAQIRPQDTSLGRLILVDRGGGLVGLLTGPVQEIIPMDPATGNAPARDGGVVARIHVHAGRALNVLDTEILFTRIGRLCQAEEPLPRRSPASALPAGA